ncbi:MULTISPECIES: hypothetical protein [unclassified Tateyamaria]|nr:hypothetical protein [Tateyamaria sp. Alg231-49]
MSTNPNPKDPPLTKLEALVFALAMFLALLGFLAAGAAIFDAVFA